MAVDLGAAIRESSIGVVVRGAGTHRQFGNEVKAGCDELRVPDGIVSYDPDEMTVTVRGGTTIASLSAALAEHRQEVPLDPGDVGATVGGVLACGVSGLRRLRLGPLRDTVLEVQFVDGTGTLIKGGGPVVKNVTGYDLPRLIVGSIGTLGVIVQTTLRARPLPIQHSWFATDADPDVARALLFRPSAVLWDGLRTSILLEGYPDDIESQRAFASLGVATPRRPTLPAGAHQGRISLPPDRLRACVSDLMHIDGAEVLAEMGVGTVHFGAPLATDLVAARLIAHQHRGWLLRERGGPEDFDGFGVPIPNASLTARIKAAFDPLNKLAPGRMNYDQIYSG